MSVQAVDAGLAFDVRGIAKSYGARRALDGVDLTVARGEMVALIGPSGSGKSTLLRALTGFVRADPPAKGAPGGRVEALGRSVQADGRLDPGLRRTRAQIGYVAQSFNLVSRLTLFSNVMVGALARTGFWRGLLGLWPAEEKAQGMAALARVGVADYAGQRAGTLSGGQQQRGAIARCLVQGAEAVIADEPVASLDPAAARKVMDTLRGLNRDDGLTVLVTLHQVDYAVRYCPRVVALKAGRIVYDGPSGGLDRAMLIDIYGPEFEAVAGPGLREEEAA